MLWRTFWDIDSGLLGDWWRQSLLLDLGYSVWDLAIDNPSLSFILSMQRQAMTRTIPLLMAMSPVAPFTDMV